MLWESTLPLPYQRSEDQGTGFEIHRLKGRLLLTSGTVKMVQGVREVFEITELATTGETIDGGKMALIGRNVAGRGWEESVVSCLEGRL